MTHYAIEDYPRIFAANLNRPEVHDGALLSSRRYRVLWVGPVTTWNHTAGRAGNPGECPACQAHHDDMPGKGIYACPRCDQYTSCVGDNPDAFCPGCRS